MNKRKDRKDDDDDNSDDAKKRSPGVFQLRETRDLAEARGYFAAKLDEEGVVLARLIEELKAGKKDILSFGEPALKMIRREIGRVETNENIYYNLELNEFTLIPNGQYVTPLMTTEELNTLEFNERQPPPQPQNDPVIPNRRNDDDDNDTQVDEEEAPPKEIDSYDLFELAKSFDSDEQRLFAERSFVVNFHESLYDHPSDRKPFLFNKQPIWAVIVQKLRDLMKGTDTLLMYVYYDCISHNLFASTELFQESETLMMLFATNDLLQTFELRRYAPYLQEQYYVKLVRYMETNQFQMSYLRYGNGPFEKSLATAYPPVAENERLTPFALMFYPATCDFAFFQFPFSFDESQYIRLRTTVKKHEQRYDAILIQQTYNTIYSDVFKKWIQTDNDLLVANQYSSEFDQVLLSNRLPGDSGNPTVPTSKSLYRNNSRYSLMLNNLWKDNLLNVACPQTERAEVLYIAMFVYRGFVEQNQTYSETTDLYGLFRTTHDSKSEAAIRYCADINKVDTDESTSIDFEKFFEDCIVLANYGKFSDDLQTQWNAIFPLNLEYINSFGRWQGALQVFVDQLITPFGELQTDSVKVLRDILYQYQESCLSISRGEQNFIEALQGQINISTMVSRLVENANIDPFDLTLQDTDMELIDDMLYDRPYTDWPNLMLGREPLSNYVNRIITVDGLDQCVLIDKVTHSTEYFTEQGGPIATYNSVMERNSNSVILYSRFAPRLRIRKMLLLKQLRPAISLIANPEEAMQRADEEGDRQREEEERKEQQRRRKRVDRGTFADSSHENFKLVLNVRQNLYPAQHSNTAWREMMYLGVTVYRKFVEYPRDETEIGNRSQFDLWKRFASTNLESSEKTTFLLELIEIARRRLILLIGIFKDNKRKAYDVFLEELLLQCVANAEKDEIVYKMQYVNSARRYEVGQGKLQKTLNFIYELEYIPVGIIKQQALRFNRSLNTYIDQPLATDNALTDEIFTAYNELIAPAGKDIGKLFEHDAESEVIRELLDNYKEKTPLVTSYIGSFRDQVARQLDKLSVSERKGASVYVFRKQEPNRFVYSIGAVPANPTSNFLVLFTFGTVLPFPFPAEETANLILLFKV